MKKFLLAMLVFAAMPFAHADAAYYWERTRNTYTGDGRLLMVDPSSPRAVVAGNYNSLANYYGYKTRKTNNPKLDVKVEDCQTANGDVLAVSHAMPATMPVQNSSPVYIGEPKVIAYPVSSVQSAPISATPVSLTPPSVAPASVDAGNDMLPPSYQPASYSQPIVLPAPAGDTVTSYPASYQTEVSPGYGYADSDTMVPLQ